MRVLPAPLLALSLALSPVSSVTIDINTTLVADWEGWGTSLAWWANVFGQREDIADALFTLNSSVSVETYSVPGLGMNIARYNLGGSSFIPYTTSAGETVSMKVSSAMPGYKAIETFWQDPLSSDPSSSSWNWTADANQRQSVLLATQRGVNILEAFSNAPPWWMTKNLASAGGDNGSADNLAVAFEQTFAQFFAIVASEASKRLGVEFQYVEPFNEPSATWWTYPQGQEGCHFSVESQARVVSYLRQSLDEYGLQSVAVAASDENSPTVSFTTLTTLASTVPGVIGKVNTHDYDNGVTPYRGPDRGKLAALATANGMKLWDSENGEGDASGLTMAQSIALDLNEMLVSAFVYWQPLDGSGWGLLQADDLAGTVGEANPKYHVLAQYSRHIRPGMRIIGTDDLKATVAAVDEAQKLLVLVVVNANATEVTVEFDLSAFSPVQTSVKAWTTETSGTGALYEESEETVEDAEAKVFNTTVPALGVKTLEILFG